MRRWWTIGATVWAAVAVAVGGGGCREKEAPSLERQVAAAHEGDTFRARRVLSGNVHVSYFDDRTPQFDARFLIDVRGSRVRMQVTDESVLVWDGAAAWVSPATSTWKDARGTLRIWPTLVTLPLRVGGPGTSLGEARQQGQEEGGFLVADFSPGDGLGPVTLSIDPGTKLVALAGLGPERARLVEPSLDGPLGITFYGYRRLDEVVIPTEWRLWRWTKELGIHGRPIGEGRVYNLEFVADRPGMFAPPAGARRADEP